MWQRNAHLLSFLTILLVGTLSAQQPLLTPQAGLLLLRNGQILQGEITRAGDYYVVTLGPSGEIKLPAQDVEAQVENLAAAYAYKQTVMLNIGAAPHLDLAEWCLRHGLKSQCAEQLMQAMRIQPENPRLTAIERRLQYSVETVRPVAPAAPTTGTLSNEQVESALRDVSPAALERFSTVVQPLLLNRCGANQCHGPNAKSELSLLRPANGQNFNQRFTQRNLYSVLQHIDREHYENSPLLVLPQRRHGSAPAAVFDEHTRRQLDELTAWVKLVTGYEEPPPPPPAAQPATVSTPAAVALHQNGAASGIVAPSSPATPAETGPAAPLAGKPSTSEASNPSRFVPRDEFDPEIFNRHYFPVK